MYEDTIESGASLMDACEKREVPQKTAILVGSLLCLLTALIYSNVLQSDFISYDDPLYILDRVQIPRGLTFENIRWALTATSDSNWIPVTWLSYLLDTTLFGVSARAYHAVNLLFHLINTLLVLLVLQRMTGYFWRSAAVAALFALHPLHVESVAWIAERKDVLSGLFFLLTILAYHSYCKSPSLVRYLVVLLAYIAGLCSKSMLVTMPFFLLLLDYWPLNRRSFDGKTCVPLGRLVVEKIPFLCCAVASAVITYNVQDRTGAVVDYASSSLAMNIKNALVSYGIYLYKTVFPVNLSVAYPFNNDIPLVQPLLAGIFLLAISYCALRWRSERPYFVVGWIWFLGMLGPVIGIIRVGPQSMADRYTYLPHLGLFVMVVWWLAESESVKHFSIHYRIVAVGLIFSVYGLLAWKQVNYWQNSMTLFSHAIEVTENNWVAFEHLGAAYNKRGDAKRASEYTQESIRINPRNSIAYSNMGIFYNNMQNSEQAILNFKKALEINPLSETARFHLGMNLIVIGDLAGAMNEYGILLSMNKERADYLLNAISQVGQMRTNSNDK